MNSIPKKPGLFFCISFFIFVIISAPANLFAETPVENDSIEIAAEDDSKAQSAPGNTSEDIVEPEIPTEEPAIEGTTAASTSSEEVGSLPGDDLYGLAMAENNIFVGSLKSKIPLKVPPGRCGMAPDLNLTYKSFRKKQPPRIRLESGGRFNKTINQAWSGLYSQ